jgi:rubrerythrin
MLDKKIEDKILTAQKNEITEQLICSKLARSVKGPKNKSILKRISEDELKHYDLRQRPRPCIKGSEERE